MSHNAVRSISVVIPCYRSEATLPSLVKKIESELSKISTAYEIVLVVDGSPDNTWGVAASLASQHVRALRLSRNFGQHNALLAGIRAARYDVVVTMDDDLQHRPDEIHRLIAELDHGYDLVYGVPAQGAHGVARNFLSRTVKRVLAFAMGVPNAQDIGAFRAFRASLSRGFDHVEGPHVSLDVALSWTTNNVGRVEITLDPREQGNSNYSFRTLVRHAINLIIGYSVIPLRIVTYLGFVLGFFGVALLGFVLWRYLTGDTTVAGFTSMASMIAMFSGAQLLAIGVLGEYLARIHMRSMGQPSYVVAEENNF